MTNAAETIDIYVAAWGETDAAKRRQLIEQCWDAEGVYVDPQSDVKGRDGLDATIAGFHSFAPGAGIVRTSAIDQHHNQVRFAWAFRQPDGSTPIVGIDVGEITADGKLARIVGFWGDPPAM